MSQLIGLPKQTSLTFQASHGGYSRIALLTLPDNDTAPYRN